MSGLLGFALSFAPVVWIWYEHNVFFRLFAMEDRVTVTLNAVLLFVVLFYVYPLKFLTSMLLFRFFGIGPGVADMSLGDSFELMTIYSVGFVMVFGVLALMYLHAYMRRASLKLDELERFDARGGAQTHAVSVFVGLISIALAQTGSESLIGASGWIYGMMGPLHGVNGYLLGSRRVQLKSRLAGTSAAQVGADPSLDVSSGV
jgi:hypothetical protein